MIKSNPCKECGSIFHTKMYHTPRKPLKRTAIKPKNHIADTSKKASKPKANKVGRKALTKKLLAEVKLYIKIRDNYTCQYDGELLSGANCHASHVYPVGGYSKMQFDPLNMKVLCYRHHILWWHKNPIEAGDWYKTKFPERWEYLQDQAINAVKIPTCDMQEMIDDYRAKNKELLNA